MLCRQIHFNIRATYIIHSPCICPHSVYRFPVYLYSCNHFLHDGFYFPFLIDLPSIDGTGYIHCSSACCLKLSLCTNSIISCCKLCNIICHVLLERIVIPYQLTFLIKLQPVLNRITIQCRTLVTKCISNACLRIVVACFQC